MEQHQLNMMTVGVIRLEGSSNWNLWKFQVSVLLKSFGLFGVVDGTLPKPKADDKDQHEWQKKDNKAQSIIVTRVSENAMLHIITCTSASEMWTKLLSIYEQKSDTSLHMVQQQFFQLKYESGMSVATFISKVQELQNRIKQLGEDISEKMVITKILMSLPDSYKYFIAAWESAPDEKQNINNLAARLIAEEERLKSNEDSTNSVALVTKGGSSSKTVLKCFGCGLTGHVKSQCKNMSNNREVKRCYYCDKPGHFKKQCYFRKKEKNGKIKINENAFSAAMCTVTPSVDNRWLVDSGASEHMTFDRGMFDSDSYQALSITKPVVIGDGRVLIAIGIGRLTVSAFNGQCFINTTVNNVLYVPDLKMNLFSVTSAVNKGFKIRIDNDRCEFIKQNNVCATAKREGKLYVMNFKFKKVTANVACSLSDWHEKLVHQNMEKVKNILSSNNIKYDNNKNTCSACLMGKQHRLMFPRSETCTSQVCELVHADVCGPMEQESLGGSRYFLLLKDDYSNHRTVYFMKNKSETFEKLRTYLKYAETTTGNVVRTLRTDNGSEFINKQVKSLLDDKGVTHETTVPYTPEQNGRAERDLRTVVEASRSMLHAKSLSKVMWAEAVNTSVYVLNRTGNARFERKTPHELWTGKSFDIQTLQIFGSEVYTHVPKEKRKKWDPKGEKGIFVGYSETTKGYRVYYPHKNKIEVKRDIVFTKSTENKRSQLSEGDLENQYIEVKNQDGEENETSQLDEETGNQGGEENETGQLLEGEVTNQDREGNERDQLSEGEVENLSEDEKASNQSTKEKTGGQEREENEGNKLSDRNDKNDQTMRKRQVNRPKWWDDYEVSLTCNEQEPINYEEAMSRSDANQWSKAIENELKSLEENNSWTLVNELPVGKNAINSKWVFKLKESDNGRIKYKARLVARGFEQKDKFDINDLYAPVAKLSTFRVFITVANKLKLQVHQMDICSAFLNSEIVGDVYMKLPESCNNALCKLNKCIYGLKMAPKSWNSKFDTLMSSQSFVRSKNDTCLYTKCNGPDKIFLLVYVDDILYFSNNEQEVNKLRSILCNSFKVKDMGNVSKYLGISVRQDCQKGITIINQKEYICNLLTLYGMSDCKPATMPIEKNFNFDVLKREVSESEEIENKCRILIGSLMYIVLGSRPDLCAPISILSRFQSCASTLLYKLLKHVLRYLKGTADLSLVYRSENNNDSLQCYVDSDWGGCVLERKSTTGFCMKVFGCTVLWSSKKQQSVSLSTAEAEYIALTVAVSECLWLRKLMLDFCFDPMVVNIYEDNQSAIKIANNPGNIRRVKHLEIKYYFVKEKIEAKIIKIEYIRTDEQLADLFTKPLGNVLFQKFRDKVFESA